VTTGATGHACLLPHGDGSVLQVAVQPGARKTGAEGLHDGALKLRLVAPPGDDDLGNYEDWMRVLLTHELAHVVHLEQARGWWGLLRHVLGRGPFLFPNAVTPMWTVEGLATFEETQHTAFGRGRDPDSRMVLRMEALAHGLPREDEPVLGRDRWPGGQAGYLFGQAFLRDAIPTRVPANLLGADSIRLRGVEPEHLRPQFTRDLRVAVTRPQRG